MSPLMVVAVALAGGFGSSLRYLVDNSLPARLRARFPYGTVLINLTGSFALGAIIGAVAHGSLPGSWLPILGTGLVGGYTTFSTASYETIRLLHDRRGIAAAVNGLGVLVGCVLLATLGLVLFG